MEKIMIASSHLAIACRRSDICAGCGKEKGKGISGQTVVCYQCWYRPDGGLKWWGGTLGEWLMKMEIEQMRGL